jgi:tRNA G18 (ribose-2'-O)-methylase SpoU
MKDRRNVSDFYKDWTKDSINAHLDVNRHKFGILCCNFNNDFNIATTIRNNNAFLAKEVFIYGHKKWDRRGAVGAHLYSRIHHLATEEDLGEIGNYTWIDYTWIGIDNIEGAVPMDSFVWPKNTLMCFGQEQMGLPPEIIDRCQNVVYIKQYGSVRSLNVGTASGIAMYDYTSKL